MDNAVIFGWDASDYDWDRGPMNLALARQKGMSFFTHKATEGTHVQHKYFGAAMSRAKTAGTPFLGAYHVPRTPGNGRNGTIAAQVSYFLNYVTNQAPWWSTFPGWFWQVDTEHWGYDSVSAATGNAFANALAKATGKKVMHYAPEWAYNDTVPVDHPLWASNYVKGVGSPQALYPGNGSSRWRAYSGRPPSILQYTSSGNFGQPNCDCNAFRGTESDFGAFIGVPTNHPTTSLQGDNDMGKLFLARENTTGAVFLCDLVQSKWIQSPHVMDDTMYLAGELGLDVTVGPAAADSEEWTSDGIRKGWNEPVFGIIVGPVPPGLPANVRAVPSTT